MISEDRKTGLIVASMSGSDNEAPKYARQLADELLHDRDGVTVRAAARRPSTPRSTARLERPAVHGIARDPVELFPAGVGVRWPAGGGAADRGRGLRDPRVDGGAAYHFAVHRVSIYALNLAVALGLALAIDYTLLILSRYRDELAEGADREGH